MQFDGSARYDVLGIGSANYTTAGRQRICMVAIGEHYRSTGEAAPPGVYRVVGTTEAATLLRVTDTDGRRRHTGEIVSVSRERLDREFEPASEPPGGFALGQLVLGPVRNLYWSVYAAWLVVRRRLP